MANWASQRKHPYTALGLSRLKCIACDQPAVAQFQVCADGNVYRPVCSEHDRQINSAVLCLMGHPDVDTVMREYMEVTDSE